MDTASCYETSPEPLDAATIAGARESTSEAINEWNENCLYRADGNVLYAGDTYRCVFHVPYIVVGIASCFDVDNSAIGVAGRSASWGWASPPSRTTWPRHSCIG